ncbi:oxidoreductase-like protein [Piedraia hortae CBS 480.64]|uniref:Oxidoreductase-like protein n=1 Tax=Piedraia hortae CBS 480.64 TaxID=1314780 RepID=A0A6A7BRQ2_9PEZI|nr:oxidoreductase-like protein [Piedraia hortae CBS 480.64]
MSSSQITFGTIGTNWITDSWIDAANKAGQWKLVAVYSRTLNGAKAYGQKHSCDAAACFDDLGRFFQNQDMQAVYIASPNSLHYEQAKQALQAGKHVILEKPATCTPEELDDLLDVAKKAGLFLIEAYRHIQEANYKKLRDLVKEKKLGQVYGASFTYATFSSRYSNVLKGEIPNVFSAEFGGGSLVDIGVYPVTFAVGLFGAPKSQKYVPFICRTGVDAGGVILLQYDKFGVQINQAKAYASSAPSEIYGEQGTLTINATTDISTLTYSNPHTKQTEELAGPCKIVEKPNVNMEEEAVEFARIINEKDHEAAGKLADISRAVIRVTTDLRRQNGILYPADPK